MGFVSVTSEVDLGVLDRSFQLEPYHHLRHPAPPSTGIVTLPQVNESLFDLCRLWWHRVRAGVTVSAEY